MINAKAYRRTYYLTHREQMIDYAKKWKLAHPQRAKKLRSKYYYAHSEEAKVDSKVWKQAHPKERKEIEQRAKAKRKQLGFIPLNKPFEGSVAHHVDTWRVIYIPRALHHSVWHSLSLNINMSKINRLAFVYLEQHEIGENPPIF